MSTITEDELDEIFLKADRRAEYGGSYEFSDAENAIMSALAVISSDLDDIKKAVEGMQLKQTLPSCHYREKPSLWQKLRSKVMK
jgi:hypothetical protein